MGIYLELAKLFKKILTPDQIIEFLPVILNVTQVVISKGEKTLSAESMLYVQTEVERKRAELRSKI